MKITKPTEKKLLFSELLLGDFFYDNNNKFCIKLAHNDDDYNVFNFEEERLVKYFSKCKVILVNTDSIEIIIY